MFRAEGPLRKHSFLPAERISGESDVKLTPTYRTLRIALRDATEDEQEMSVLFSNSGTQNGWFAMISLQHSHYTSC